MADLEKGFSRTLLRNVRKAESSYLSFHRRTDQHAVKCFYKLHVITRRKLGVPVQPKGFFMQLYMKMIATGLGYVGIVEREDRPIAAAVFLTFNKTTIYKYGASDPKHLHTRPNEFLFYHAIRGAGETGDTHFDFGVTAMDNGGLRSFKKKWGPTEEHVHHAYVVGHPPPADTKSHALTIASAVIRHTPKVVCRGLGEVFYRFSQ
jgi:lipid II:glycine glycyltransferase (peptidoglycan interpeptide bridge formation enzyme)